MCQIDNCQKLDCGNCIFCQQKLSILCGHCPICSQPFQLVIESNANFINIFTTNKVNYDRSTKLAILRFLKDEEYSLTPQLNIYDLQENKIYQTNSTIEMDRFIFFRNIEYDYFSKLSIKIENIKLSLFIPEETENQINSYPNKRAAFCNKKIIFQILLDKNEIYNVLMGYYKKNLSLFIILNIECPTNLLSNFDGFKNIKITSFVFLSFISNTLVSMFVSVFYFKDLLDTPHMIRKNFSSKVQDFLSLFNSFDCNDGYFISSNTEAFDSNYHISDIFYDLKKQNYNTKLKDYFLYLNSEYLKSLGNCRANIVYSDLIAGGMLLFSLFLLFIKKLTNFFKNKINVK